MSDWSHGYNVSTGYTYHFFREMAPNWIDFSLRLAGYQRDSDQKKRRYLELGCGQGLGLTLLAAANPDTEFVGIDFHPGHIVHARALASAAGLSNIVFKEGDFIELATCWPEALGQFDDVALHGIISWISHDVRAAVVGCLQHAVKPGGKVYLSYNAQPGWLSAFPLQHLLRSHEKSSGLPLNEAIESGITLMQRLAAGNAGIFQSLPMLSKKLEQAVKAERAYLIQEYLHDDAWYPHWHSKVAHELRRAKLEFGGTATLPEAYLPIMLPDNLKSVVLDCKDSTARQDLIDACINQSFRRDLFVRGTLRSWPGQVAPSWTDCRFIALKDSPKDDFSFDASFAQLSGDRSTYGALMSACQLRPQSIEHMVSLPEWQGKPLVSLLQAIAFLMHGGYLAPYQPADTVAAAARFNRVLAQMASTGAPYGAIACAHTGSGILVSTSELMMLDAVEQSAQPTADVVADGLLARLARCGRTIVKDGKTLAEPGEARAEATRAAREFVAQTLPRWRVLGAWE